MSAKTKDWKQLTNDKEKYQAYLCSREWAEKREAVRERAGNRCERCKCLPMDACHHLTYERKYDEKLEDLQAICNYCHDFTHGKSDADPKANTHVIRYLIAVPKTGTPKAVPIEWIFGLTEPESHRKWASLFVIDLVHRLASVNEEFDSVGYYIHNALIDFVYHGWISRRKPKWIGRPCAEAESLMRSLCNFAADDPVDDDEDQ